MSELASPATAAGTVPERGAAPLAAGKGDRDDVTAPPESRRLRRTAWRGGLVLVPFLIALHTGSIGIDFGNHWDEHLQCRLVARTLKTGVLLPGVYNYPTMPYWLTVAALGTRVFGPLHANADLMADLNDVKTLQPDTAALQKYVLDDHGYFLRVRLIFLGVSSLAIIWVYWLVLAWRRHAGEAFLAAAFLALAWESAYHARWIAPDQVMSSFAALTMLLVMVASVRGGRKTWLHGAAVAAALATGTKYQCGLLLLPMLMVAYQTRDRTAGWRPLIRLVAGVLALFTVTFLFTTPGAYLDSGRFVSWLRLVVTIYKKGGHYGYDVAAGPAHFWKLLVYFGSDYFSFFLPVALLVAVFAGLGIWAIFRESRRQAAVFFVFPALYLAYMGTQRVFIVRNVLIVGPFLAVAAARGVRFALSRIRPVHGRAILVALVAGALTANSVWLYRAALSIPRATPQTALQDLARYVNAQPANQVYASVNVRAWLKTLGLDSPKLADKEEQAKELAFYPDDWAGFSTRRSNQSRLARTWFGPFEINWNYYTNWAGFIRILLVPTKNAAAAGVKLVARPP